jgi:hypothetical protein
VAVPLRPTGSIEVQVLLAAGDRRIPRSGVPVILRDSNGNEVARAATDFDGFVLFDALAFGSWQAEAAGQKSAALIVSRDKSDARVRLVLPPA